MLTCYPSHIDVVLSYLNREPWMTIKHKKERAVACRGLSLSSHGEGSFFEELVPVVLVIIDDLR